MIPSARLLDLKVGYKSLFGNGPSLGPLGLQGAIKNYSVTHKYTFYHKSSLIIPELQVTLKWPMKLKNGKYLLYLFDIEKSSNVKCYREAEIKNPEKYPTSNSVRSKRASENRPEGQKAPQTRMELQGALSAPVTITCDPNNKNAADCAEIFCTV